MISAAMPIPGALQTLKETQTAIAQLGEQQLKITIITAMLEYALTATQAMPTIHIIKDNRLKNKQRKKYES